MKRILLLIGILMAELLNIMAMEKAPQTREELREKYPVEAEKARVVTEQEKKRAIGEFEFHRNFKNTTVLTPEVLVKAFPVLLKMFPHHYIKKLWITRCLCMEIRQFLSCKRLLLKKN